MDAISIFGASAMLYLLQLQLGADSLWGATVPWLLAALFYNEINLWLLGFLFRLQQGPEFRMEAFWREERWATKIDVILMVVGGALLSFAAQSYDWQGVVLFFLPILCRGLDGMLSQTYGTSTKLPKSSCTPYIVLHVTISKPGA